MRPNNRLAIAKAVASLSHSKQKGLTDVQIERELRRGKISAIISDAGVRVDSSLGVESLSFYNPDSINGVAGSLDRLVYDPSNEDPTVPWLPENFPPSKARKLVKSIVAPDYAHWFRDSAAEKISSPLTTGMLTAEMKMNKDLEQISSPPEKPELNERDSKLLNLAIEEICNKIINRLKSSPESPFYSVVNDRIQLKEWSIEDFKSEMSNAIGHSSPGYPYNGYTWQDILDDGRTVVEAVYEDGMKVINDDEHHPFVFIQGARYTGDGKTEGQQRLVQQSPAEEKLPGHIISYPLKQYIRYEGSGQLGIQQASQDIRDMARGDYSNFRIEDHLDEDATTPEFFMENDVSRWDAHCQDYQSDIFFNRVIERVYDMSDEFTRKTITNYKSCFDLRYLVTGVGAVFTRMLPSGSAVTTVFAFIIHEIYVIMADILFCCPDANSLDEYHSSKKVGIISLGLQGDDVWALVKDIGVRDSLSYVYSLFGCVMKEGSRYGSLKDEDPCMVFLNELIHLTKDVPNCVFPKWNFFYSESADQNYRTLGIDRHLYSEISSKVTHLTTIELTFARFVGKMQRFSDMECFEWLLRKIFFGFGTKPLKKVRDDHENRRTFVLRSWLGERIFSEDNPVLSSLRKLEDTTLPVEERYPKDEDMRKADRHECAWLSSKQLLSAFYLSCASASKMDQRAFFAKMRAISALNGRTQRTVKRITKNIIDSDEFKHLKDVRITERDIEDLLDFFEKVSISVIDKFSSTSEPAKTAPDEAALDADTVPKERKMREAPTVQAATNYVIGASNVDPFDVITGALSQAAKLYAKSIAEGNEAEAADWILHTSRLMDLDGDLYHAENLLKGWNNRE